MWPQLKYTLFGHLGGSQKHRVFRFVEISRAGVLSMCFRNCVSHQERATVEQTTPFPRRVQAFAIFTVSSEP